MNRNAKMANAYTVLIYTGGSCDIYIYTHTHNLHKRITYTPTGSEVQLQLCWTQHHVHTSQRHLTQPHNCILYGLGFTP
jgi:hypothetical protein